MAILVFISVINFIGIILFAVYDERFQDDLPEWFPNSSNAYIVVDFVIFTVFSILGALSGR